MRDVSPRRRKGRLLETARRQEETEQDACYAEALAAFAEYMIGLGY